MIRRTAICVILTLLLMSFLALACRVKPSMAWTGSTITINSDGSISPEDAPIHRNETTNVYTLTDDIDVGDNDGIYINIGYATLDGAGHTLHGGYREDIPNEGVIIGNNDITVKNLKVDGFYNGIELGYNSVVVVSRNTVLNSLEWNIALFGANCTVVGNSLKGFCGIWLGEGATTNFIVENKVEAPSSGWWIGAYKNSGNHIHHNNFLSNENAFWVTNSSNVWDNGYPSGGNYWSGYDGIDLCNGQYQNQTGSDGLGDEPYIINIDNQDRYPIMARGYFTPTGTGVTVFPSADVTLTFDSVTVAGFTTETRTAIGPLPPFGFMLIGDYYNVKTTVEFSGNATVEILYDDAGMTLDQERHLQLIQWKSFEGDVNDDGKVDIQDVARVSGAFGSVRVDDPNDQKYGEYWHPTPCPRCPHMPAADVNYDGKIDIEDLARTSKNFGKIQWQNITTYVDITNNVIYGETNHFSLIGIHQFA